MPFIHSHSQSDSVPFSKEKGEVRLSYSLARRIYRDTGGEKQISRPAVLTAMIGIAIGLAAMIIVVSVVIDFKSEVRNKVIGFGSHIQISNFDAVGSYETHPVVADDSMMIALSVRSEVKRMQRYSTRPRIIKTNDTFQSMVLKGIGPELDSAFFRGHLVEGKIPVFSDTASINQVVISKAIADWLKLKLGDKIYAYFIQKDVCARRLMMKDIYQANFSEYDNLSLLTDLYLVSRLNNWAPGQVSGARLQVRDYDKLEDITYGIAVDVNSKQDVYGRTHYVQSIKQMNPQTLVWLDLSDLSVQVVLILMIGVAGFMMASGLLVIILERTQMTDIPKALGANGFTIRKVFLRFSVFLTGKGISWGNIIGTTLCALQSQLGFFKLDPEAYYVSTVPVSMDIWFFLLINAGTLLASILMLIDPSCLIIKINPASFMWCE